MTMQDVADAIAGRMKAYLSTAIQKGGMTPYDTGNLANNAVKLVRTKDGYRIYVDTTIAPYMYKLNDVPASIGTSGNTYRNKHYKWWNRAVNKAFERACNDMAEVISLYGNTK